MSQYRDYTPQRSDMKKKKRLNLILNGSIGIVALLIIFISGTIIFGSDSEDASVSNNSSQEENNQTDLNISSNEENEENNFSNEENDNSGNISVNNDEDSSSENDADQESNEATENNENNENSNGDSSDLDGADIDNNDGNSEETDGEWGPIGTAQDELSLEFDSGTVNRDEMNRALEYATGLSQDEMEVWRIENGGDSQSAVGTVSTYEERHTPYKVTLSWVENEGWMPVSVEELSSNPYAY